MRVQFLKNGIVMTGIIALATMYNMVWGQMISNSAGRNATDFMAFYAAGRVAQAHGYAEIYNIDYQQNVQQTVVGVPLGKGRVLIYNHLPYLVPVLAFIVNADYQGSFIRWGVLLVIIYLLTSIFLINSLFTDRDLKSRLLLLGGVFTFFPIFVSIWQGQDTALLFLGTALWCVGILKKRDWLMAIGLTLVTTRPHICIVLALPLLFKYRRVWWRFVGLAGILALLSVWLLTPAGVLSFITLIRITAQGEWFGIKPEVMFNLLGLLIRSLPFLSASVINLTSWVIYGIGLVIMILLWVRSKEADEHLLGLTVLITIITAPHLHLHDLTLLIFPLLFMIKSNALKISQPAFLLIGASFVFVTGMLMNSLYYVLPYGIYIYLAWVFWRHAKNTPLSVNRLYLK